MSARIHKGQWYVEAGRFDRQRCDGSTATIITWSSQCADCAGWFTFTTPARSSKFQPNRRCQKHKRPGHRVRSAEA